MSLSTTSKVNVTLKKLNGRAHTSNDKGLINESLSSASSIFATEINIDCYTQNDCYAQKLYYTHEEICRTNFFLQTKIIFV